MLVLAADLVIAADTAKLIQVFVRRGLIPDGGVAYLLPRIVGMHKAKELVFFGDDLLGGRRGAHRHRQQGRARGRAASARPRSGPSGSRTGPTKAIGWAKKLLHDASRARRAATCSRKRRCSSS